jgi:hypothetical protein
MQWAQIAYRNPAGYQPNENVGSRGRKNRKKLLKKFRPCRYVFVDKPLKSAA